MRSVFGGPFFLVTALVVLPLRALAQPVPPLIGPEVGLTNPVSIPTPADLSGARIAFGAGSYFIVWCQHMGGLMTPHSWHVKGVRVRASDGAILDPLSIRVTRDGFCSPTVAYDGTGSFLVAFTKNWVPGPYGLFAARVSAASGQVLDPEPVLVVETEVNAASNPVLGAGGGAIYLAWRELGGVMGRRIDARGVPIDTTNTLVGAQFRENPLEVRYASSTFFILTSAIGSLLWVHRISAADGLPLPTPISLLVSNNNVVPTASLAFDDASGLLLVWRDEIPGYIRFLGRRISILTGAFEGVAQEIVLTGQVDPSVAFDGTNFMLTWQGVIDFHPEIIMRRVTPDLQFPDRMGTNGGFPLNQDPSAKFLPKVQSGPAGQVFAIWERPRQNGTTLYGRRVEEAGVVSFPEPAAFPITVDASEQSRVAVASGGGGLYFAAWRERRDLEGPGETALWGARIDANGNTLDRDGVLLAAGVGDGPPAVASDGTDFLVAWTDATNVRFARVRASDGVLLDAVPLALGEAGSRHPKVSFASGLYFLAWEAPDGVRAVRIDPLTGLAVDAGALIEDPASPPGSTPAVSCGSTSCLVAWNASGVLARRVRLVDGALLDNAPQAITPGGGNPALAFDGSSFLVVWEAYGTSIGSLAMTRVRESDGALLDPSPISILEGRRVIRPAVTFAGRDYVIAWAERRGGSDAMAIMATRVSTAARVLDHDPQMFAGLLVATSTSYPSIFDAPAIVSSAPERSIIVYERTQSAPQVDAPRISLRTFDVVRPGAEGAPCPSGDPGACDSGFCVDGVCCDTACGMADSTDCQACSIAAGRATNGLCGPVTDQRVCRPSANSCDPVERCDGIEVSCPADDNLGACADAGQPDGPVEDDGATEDAGFTDGAIAEVDADLDAETDAGSVDAAEPTDGASEGEERMPDATSGSTADRDSEIRADAPAESTEERRGCGCTATRGAKGRPGSLSDLLLLGALLVLGRSSRRARSERLVVGLVLLGGLQACSAHRGAQDARVETDGGQTNADSEVGQQEGGLGDVDPSPGDGGDGSALLLDGGDSPDAVGPRDGGEADAMDRFDGTFTDAASDAGWPDARVWPAHPDAAFPPFCDDDAGPRPDASDSGGCQNAEGNACAFGDHLGICRDGGCTRCVDRTDDSACITAYGDPHLCIQGDCVEGECRVDSDCDQPLPRPLGAGRICGLDREYFCRQCSSDSQCQQNERYGPTYYCATATGYSCQVNSCNVPVDFCFLNSEEYCCPGPTGNMCTPGICCSDLDCNDGRRCIQSLCIHPDCGSPPPGRRYVNPAFSNGGGDNFANGSLVCPFSSISRAIQQIGFGATVPTEVFVLSTGAVWNERVPIMVPPNVHVVGDPNDPPIINAAGTVFLLSAPNSGLSNLVIDGLRFAQSGVVAVGGSTLTTTIDHVLVTNMLNDGIIVRNAAGEAQGGVLVIGPGVRSSGNGSARAEILRRSGLVISGSGTAIIRAASRNDAIVFSGNTAHGIVVRDQGRVIIDGHPAGTLAGSVEVRDNAYAGLRVEQDPDQTRPLCDVRGLVAVRNGLPGGAWSGIDVRAGSNVRIRGSIALANRGSGIRVSTRRTSTTTFSDDVSLVDLGRDPGSDPGRSTVQSAALDEANALAGICFDATRCSGAILAAAGLTFASGLDCAATPGPLVRSATCAGGVDVAAPEGTAVVTADCP